MTETQPADPAEARKRRKAIIESQRQEHEEASVASSDPVAVAAAVAKVAQADPEAIPLKKRKIETSSDNGSKRTQIRYDPEMPMSKEALAAWRREARRVRNRESAAASRQRIRSRINELEDEVEDWKTKYNQARERLAYLEDLSVSQSKQESDKS